MAKKYKGIVNLSTAPSTLKQAEELLGLARDSKPHRAALCGCVTVMAAFALEQAINSAISFHSKCVAVELGIPREQTTYAELELKTFRFKMERLPVLLTAGEFGLNYASAISNHLQKLITLRNQLAHVAEPALELEAQNVSVESGRVVMRVPIPDLIWTSVSIFQAEQYIRAVDCYLNEVLFPGQEYKAGELLIKKPKTFRGSKRGNE